jgi:predicted transcriptional regulator
MIIKSLKTEVTIGGTKAESYYDTAILDGKYDVLDLLQEQLNASNYITDYKIYDGEKIVAVKATVDKAPRDEATELLKAKCTELYAIHNNYAKVASLIGRHPTTVRSWIKEGL